MYRAIHVFNERTNRSCKTWYFYNYSYINYYLEGITYPLSSISPKVILENGEVNSKRPIIPSFWKDQNMSLFISVRILPPAYSHNHYSNSLQVLSAPNGKKLLPRLPDFPIQHHGCQGSQSGYELAPASVFGLLLAQFCTYIIKLQLRFEIVLWYLILYRLYKTTHLFLGTSGHYCTKITCGQNNLFAASLLLLLGLSQILVTEFLRSHMCNIKLPSYMNHFHSFSANSQLFSWELSIKTVIIFNLKAYIVDRCYQLALTL